MSTLLTEAQTVAKQKIGIADAAVKAAEANVKERDETAKKSVEAKAAADKALADAQAKDKPEADKLAAAKAELDKDKENADLKKKVTAAEAAVTAQAEAVKKAVEGQASAVTGVERAEKAKVAAKERLDSTNAAKKASEEFSKAADAKGCRSDRCCCRQCKVDLLHLVFAGWQHVASSGEDGIVRLYSGGEGKTAGNIQRAWRAGCRSRIRIAEPACIRLGRQECDSVGHKSGLDARRATRRIGRRPAGCQRFAFR